MNRWTRAELKSRGKAAFKRNYWWSVLAALILAAILGGALKFDNKNDANNNVYVNARDDFNMFFEDGLHGDDLIYAGERVFESVCPSTLRSLFTSAVAAIAVILSMAGLLVSIFVFNVLEVGGRGYFIKNAVDGPEMGKFVAGFKNGHYGNIVLTMFKRNLFNFLWFMLFVIPGIIKLYEYRMIPYLLAEYPEKESNEIFAMSKEMMAGEKWNTFVLDLSFILWHVLSTITSGIVGVFYVNPYVYATGAELYLTLRRKVAPTPHTEDPYGDFGNFDFKE